MALIFGFTVLATISIFYYFFVCDTFSSSHDSVLFHNEKTRRKRFNISISIFRITVYYFLLYLYNQQNDKKEKVLVNKDLTEKAKEDLKIIELALTKGDPRAYNTLMSKYRDPIFFMLYERVNDRELAKELTIEAFGKAFNKLDSYTPKFAFSTWLYSIARNNCIDYLRKKKLPTYSIDTMIEHDEGSQTATDIPYQGDGPEKKMMNKQRIQILRNIVEQLKPNYRELVKLRYFKEYSYKEISVELEIPIGTVKAQLFRSREQLFKILSGKKDTF